MMLNCASDLIILRLHLLREIRLRTRHPLVRGSKLGELLLQHPELSAGRLEVLRARGELRRALAGLIRQSRSQRLELCALPRCVCSEHLGALQELGRAGDRRLERIDARLDGSRLTCRVGGDRYRSAEKK